MLKQDMGRLNTAMGLPKALKHGIPNEGMPQDILDELARRRDNWGNAAEELGEAGRRAWRMWALPGNEEAGKADAAASRASVMAGRYEAMRAQLSDPSKAADYLRTDPFGRLAQDEARMQPRDWVMRVETSHAEWGANFQKALTQLEQLNPLSPDGPPVPNALAVTDNDVVFRYTLERAHDVAQDLRACAIQLEGVKSVSGQDYRNVITGMQQVSARVVDAARQTSAMPTVTELETARLTDQAHYLDFLAGRSDERLSSSVGTKLALDQDTIDSLHQSAGNLKQAASLIDQHAAQYGEARTSALKVHALPVRASDVLQDRKDDQFWAWTPGAAGGSGRAPDQALASLIGPNQTPGQSDALTSLAQLRTPAQGAAASGDSPSSLMPSRLSVPAGEGHIPPLPGEMPGAQPAAAAGGSNVSITNVYPGTDPDGGSLSVTPGTPVGGPVGVDADYYLKKAKANRALGLDR
jgi:hypothetical protein